MSKGFLRLGFSAVLCAATACFAQNSGASSPDGATGQCKDGTYTKIPTKSKACQGHQGVKVWYATVGGPTNPDIKSPRATQSSSKPTSNSDAVVNPHSDTNMSNARANAINKKSPNAAVATRDDNGKTLPGPAASGGTGRNSTKGSSPASMAGRAAAPGGGPGMVWLNNDTHVYHCYGSQYYGKTKNGKYVTEKDAINMGAKGDHGKACSQ